MARSEQMRPDLQSLNHSLRERETTRKGRRENTLRATNNARTTYALFAITALFGRAAMRRMLSIHSRHRIGFSRWNSRFTVA